MIVLADRFKLGSLLPIFAGFLFILVAASLSIGPVAAQNASGDGDAPDAPQAPSGGSPIFLPFLAHPNIVAGQQMWLSRAEIAALPTSGPAWENLLEAAQEDTDDPDISDQNDSTNVYVLAKALVYARTGQASYRQEVIEALREAMGTEAGGRTLAAGRNLPAYVIAAGLVNLSADPSLDGQFRGWLRSLLNANLDGDTLRSTHETRPNNWGTHAGAARVAIAIYLGDRSELARAAQVFKGYLGDRSAYAGFSFGDLWWQCDPQRPVGVNPAGCTIQGHSVDGVLTDDQRRGGEFTWPPPQENYAWEGLQGALVQAQLLQRAGYPAWEWEDRALLRAVTWLHEHANYPADGDDEWQPWLVNAVYGTNFPAELPARHGKNMGWTDWIAPAIAR